MPRDPTVREGSRPVWVRAAADSVTVLRILLLPLYLLALRGTSDAGVWEVRGWGGAALGLLVVMAVSDKADGLIARSLGTVSRRGAILDAVADRSVQVFSVAFFTFVAGPPLPRFPVWLLGVYVLRDVLLGTGWLLMRGRRRRVRPEHEWHGKTATFLSFLLIGGATAAVAWSLLQPLAWCAVAMVLVSTAAYIRVNLDAGR